MISVFGNANYRSTSSLTKKLNVKKRPGVKTDKSCHVSALITHNGLEFRDSICTRKLIFVRQ